jgi:hypothetical protein
MKVGRDNQKQLFERPTFSATGQIVSLCFWPLFAVGTGYWIYQQDNSEILHPAILVLFGFLYLIFSIVNISHKKT